MTLFTLWAVKVIHRAHRRRNEISIASFLFFFAENKQAGKYRKESRVALIAIAPAIIPGRYPAVDFRNGAIAVGSPGVYGVYGVSKLPGGLGN